MTKLSVLAAIALTSSTMPRSGHATPIVACGSPNCAVDKSVTPSSPLQRLRLLRRRLVAGPPTAPLTTHRRQCL